MKRSKRSHALGCSSISGLSSLGGGLWSLIKSKFPVPPQRRDRGDARRQDHVGSERGQFRCVAVEEGDVAAAIAPLVFLIVTDPVGQGFVESLAHPGGTFTGFTDHDAPMA